MDRRWLLLGLVGSVTVASFAACGGAEETGLDGDAGPLPTSTGTSTGTTPTSTTTTPAPSSDASSPPPSDAAPPVDASADVARPDAGTSMSFFVTSTGSGNMGGNLGGLTGADAKCQSLATAAGVGGRTWKAYLSITGTNAKDRIGTGPWYNQKGKMIAASVAALHATDIPAADVLDEKGGTIPTNQHDLLTGSNADGTATNTTCQGWTSNANNQQGFVGHTDSSTTGQNTDRWNNAHVTTNCNSFTAQGGAGRFACFASN